MFAEWSFIAALLCAIAGSVLSLVFSGRGVWCNRVCSSALALASFFSIASALFVLAGNDFVLTISTTVIPGMGTFSLSFSVGALQAFFLFMISFLTLAVAIYCIGFNQRYLAESNATVTGMMLNLFFLSMVSAVTADNVILFLISWEAVSLTSYLLIVNESRREGGTNGGMYYLVMTHIGAGMIMAGMLLMASYADSFQFSALNGIGSSMPDLARDAAFVLLLFGFGAKAGLVPLQVWMPYTYKATPGSVAALLSGATIKIAILMMVRCIFEFLGIHNTWWGLLVLSLACVTALLGVLYANLELDLKRLLAFSSMENVGIMLMAMGASMLFLYYPGLETLSALAMIALLFHALNHAMFKGLLFLAAGSVERATGETNMERLGGLAKKMPVTSALFLVGAMSISALPPFNGFVSEWLIFQTLLQSFQIADMSVKLLLPVTVAVLALTGALATAAFVRAYGAVFLARPRSDTAESARESPNSMLVGMAILAAMCAVGGVMASVIIPLADKASTTVLGVSAGDLIVDGWIVQSTTPGFASMSPMLLAIPLLVALPVGFYLSRYFGGRARSRKDATWDCGTPLTSRNEYSATAFSQPIARVFSSIYRPQTEVHTEYTSSPYVKKKVSYSNRLLPVFEKYLYRPAVDLSVGMARRFSRIQAGSIQAYLAYIFVMLVLLLIVFR